jgi:hypothetical protein
VPGKIPPHLLKKAQEEFRARFTPGFYHGTGSRDIEQFAPGPRGATFVTKKPRFANSFAPIDEAAMDLQKSNDILYQPGATVYPLSVNLGKHFDYETPEGLSLISEYVKTNKIPSKTEDALKTGAWDVIEDPRFMDFLKNQGFDTFSVREMGTKNVGVFNPKNIRGKFAEYNPEHAESADFMKARGGLVNMSDGGTPPRNKAQAAMAVGKGALNLLRPQVNRVDMHYKDVTKRIPQLQEAAKKLQSGEPITREEYEMLVNAYKPVRPYDFVPKPATREEAISALEDKEMFGLPSQMLQKGRPVGLRLDIPAYSRHGVWVPTIHEQAAGFGAGKKIGHESFAAVTDPTFGMSEKAALSIAAGKPKGTIATIKGNWNPMSEEEALDRAQDYLRNPNWRQAGMDPERHSYFYDRASMEPIVAGEEALQVGPLVLVKKPKYASKEGFAYSQGGLAYLASGGKTPAWQRAEGKNPEGGLNAKGRASYKAETGGTLKRPQPEGGARRDSFCARMKGMKKKLTSAETANDPDSRINKSLRAWNCAEGGLIGLAGGGKTTPLRYAASWLLKERAPADTGSVYLRNPLHLADEARLSGFTSPEQNVFFGRTKTGQEFTIPREYVDPETILRSRDKNKTAEFFKDMFKEYKKPE